MKTRLLETQAHILLGQEVHLLGLDVDYASEWARSRGWKSIVEHAIPGKQEPFSSGGVAIFVRDWLGLSVWPSHPDDCARGRLVSGLLEAPGYGSILLVFAYLVAGANLDEQSLGILEKLGRVLTTSIHPYIEARDFQVSPGTMATIDFTQAVGATLVTASDGLGSCRGSRGWCFYH